jgi:putative heme degradation protein
LRLTLRRWSAAALLALAGIELHAQTQTVRLYLEALDECGPVTGLTRNDIAIFDRASTQYVLEYSNSTGEPSAD